MTWAPAAKSHCSMTLYAEAAEADRWMMMRLSVMMMTMSLLGSALKNTLSATDVNINTATPVCHRLSRLCHSSQAKRCSGRFYGCARIPAFGARLM